MQTRTCPLCGLQAPAIEDHATNTHGLTLDAAEALLEEGRRQHADELEAHARLQHRQTIYRLGDDGIERKPGAAIDGGYL